MEGLWVGSTSAISALPELKRKFERPVRMPASGARMRASRYAPPGDKWTSGQSVTAPRSSTSSVGSCSGDMRGVGRTFGRGEP
jgi:hypothetical protein